MKKSISISAFLILFITIGYGQTKSNVEEQPILKNTGTKNVTTPAAVENSELKKASTIKISPKKVTRKQQVVPKLEAAEKKSVDTDK